MRHGGKVVFFGRFVAVLRVLAAFLAGANRMPWMRFFAFNVAGGIVWAMFYGCAAYAPSRRGCCHPRPSQTRTCRFPASGSSGESFAPDGVEMDDPGRWQRALLQECRQTRPGVGALTIPSRQPSLPDPHNLVGIPAHPSTVPRHAVVGVMAPQAPPRAGLFRAGMHSASPSIDRRFLMARTPRFAVAACRAGGTIEP